MKAMLVFDMPKDCLYCPCFRAKNEEFDFDDCKLALRPLTVDERDNKPNWCPLKPMPKKKIHIAKYNIWKGYSKEDKEIMIENRGYNKCVDEILGEQE